jgi:hypothetical protein
MPQSRERRQGAYRAVWHTCKRSVAIVGKVLAASLFAFSCWQLWVAIRPEPTFSPGDPSFGNPFDIPFDVTNGSILFDMRHVSIECVLVSPRISTDYAKNVVFDGTTVSTGSVSTLEAGKTRSHKCPFSATLGRTFNSEYAILSGQIQFSTRYRILYGLVALSARSDLFSLDTETSPPRWTPGAPMY